MSGLWTPTTLTHGQRLASQAAAAAEVRGYQTDPDVVALRVERVRTQVERLMWAGMVLGLCFTMVNVQTFAAAGAVVGSLGWWAAWLLDPMVSLVLLGVLRAEQVTARWQVRMGPWPRVAKWSLLAGTYVMNTWSSWAAGSVSGVVLHSVPVLTVFVAAEAVTDCQDKLTECVHRAHTWATHRAEHQGATRAAAGEPLPPRQVLTPPATAAASGPGPVRPPVVAMELRAEEDQHPAPVRPQPPGIPPSWTVVAPAAPPARPTRPRSPRPARRAAPGRPSRESGGRVLFADYLATARAALTPEVEVTPAWVREVTGCSRGLSSRLAATLRTEHPGHRFAAAPASTDRPTGPEGKAA